MGLGTHKPALIVAALVLILIITVAILSSAWPKEADAFFELGLFGPNKTADSYFTDAYSTINLNATNTWFIYVCNHMGATENVSVIVKLLNSTMPLPDDQKHLPSQSISIAEFPLSLSYNETTLVPFSWSIIDANFGNGLTTIKNLTINEKPINITISDSNSSFKLVMELWVWNSTSDNYIYGWESKAGFSSASIYMGFRINSTTA